MKFGGIKTTDDMIVTPFSPPPRRIKEESENKETFNEGVKLGAGVAVGFSLVSIGIGLTAGVLGLIYERVTGE